MSDLENLGNHQPSELYEQSLRQKPMYGSAEEALADSQRQLDELAAKYGMTAKEFVIHADSDPNFNEDYLEALSLSRQIHFYQSKLANK